MHPKLKLKNISWVNTSFLISTPILAGLGLWYHLSHAEFTWQLFLLFISMYIFTGMAITGGYHRLFAHRSYQTNSFVKLLYLLFGAAAFQNSAMKWCTDHRRHHNKVDTKDDPYNINEGFWYAHILWVFLKSDPNYKKTSPDLLKSKLVTWQDRNYMSIAVLVGFGLPTLIGYFLGDAFGGFLYGGLLRVVVVHHCTFFINSLCHYLGSQTYTDENSARDSMLMAFFTYGEGYHNFHHKFQGDYRNGLRWYQFDPTKWLIQFLAFIGWAKKLIKVPEEEIFKAKLRMEHKKLLSKKQDRIDPYLEEMRARVELAQRKWRALKRDYKALKAELPEQGRLRLELMKTEIQEAKLEFKLAYTQYIKQVKLYTQAVKA